MNGRLRHKILVVEDTAMLAIDLEEMLQIAGFEVVGPANTLEAALALAERVDIQGAVLDVDLAGDTVYPLAVRLHEQNVPFLFLTGYEGPENPPESLSNCISLRKPVKEEQLLRYITSLFKQ